MMELKLTKISALTKALESVMNTRCSNECAMDTGQLAEGDMMVVRRRMCHGYTVCAWNRIEDDTSLMNIH